MKKAAIIERYGGYALAAVFSIGGYIFRDYVYDAERFPILINGALTYASITAGFLGVLLTVFISIVNREQIQETLRKLAYSGYGIKVFMRYIRHPFFVGILSIFLSFVCIYVDHIIVQSLWMFILILYTFMLVRICDILFLLFEKSLDTANTNS